MEENTLTKEQIDAFKYRQVELASEVLKQAVERISKEYGVVLVPIARIVDGRIVGDIELRNQS